MARTTIRLTCDHWRLCKPCRQRRSDRYRARFSVGRELALAANKHRMESWTPGGRWAETFYTLTLPHSDIERDAAELRQAWCRFRRLLGHYLRARGCHWRKVPFFKAVELTSSSGGHWHLHVWSLLPYVPQWLLAHLWGEALSPDYRARLPRRSVAELVDKGWESGAGRHFVGKRDRAALAWLGNPSELHAAIVDVRAPGEAAAELVKYLVKDIEAGAQVDPRWYARAYAALDGMRGVESSRQWLKVTKSLLGWSQLLKPRVSKPFCECGSCLPCSRRSRGHFLEPASA